MNYVQCPTLIYDPKVMSLSSSNRFPGKRHLISTNFHTCVLLHSWKRRHAF